ncbi:protein ALP1-like [Teleopsis dalmanni]|uniref:protein ALP1-like n=1 Tax=Teleopsis dalmanni TaxID=139649 RepID=UPI0018CDAA0E|nr:protein ALP1-like [Teleopsis dalmanni]
MDELLEDVRTITSYRRGDELSVPKSIHWRDNILCCFDEGRFLQMLRVNKSQFAHLVEIFAIDIIFKGPGSNLQLPVELQLAIVLFRLGSSGESASVRKIATIFGVGDGGTLTKITQRVFSAILKKLPVYIQWPSATERRQLIAHTFSELPFCIGYIDESEIKLAEKPSNNHEAYFSRQRIYSIKLQVVCDHKLRIMHALVGNPGSYHDSKIFKKSHIATNSAFLFTGEEWIAGDSAYQLTKHLITPYRTNSSLMNIEQQNKFNKRHSQYRVRVENCFGILKEKFCSLKQMRIKIKDKKSQKFFNSWILVCCVLHNILLEDRNFSQFESENSERCEAQYDSNTIAAPTPELKRCLNMMFE